MSELICNCPHCGQELNVESDLAGQAVNCPSCSGAFEVPEAPAHSAPVLPQAPVLAPAPKLNLPGSAPMQQPPQAPYQQAQAPPPMPGGYAPQAPQVGQPLPAPYQQAQAPPPMPGGYATQAPQLGQPQPGAPGYPGYLPGGGIGNALSDPLGGQPRAIHGLANGGTIGWGIGFCLAWILSAWLLAWRTGSALTNALGGLGMSGSDFGMEMKVQHGQWILSAAIPLLVLIAALYSLKAMAGKGGTFGAVMFTSGMAMLPMTVLVLVILMLSYSNPSDIGTAKAMMHLSLIVVIFAFSASILLVKASLSSVLGFTQKAAFWLVPTVILTVFYVSSWIGKLIE
jgi:hypothetical protein